MSRTMTSRLDEPGQLGEEQLKALAHMQELVTRAEVRIYTALHTLNTAIILSTSGQPIADALDGLSDSAAYLKEISTIVHYFDQLS